MTTHPLWMEAFPTLANAPAATREEIRLAARPAVLPPGHVVFRPGDACPGYLLVEEGSVRVQAVAEDGREILLYRVEAGETCVLTTACLLAGLTYSAEGIAETGVKARLLPAASFDRLMDDWPAFRRFVFDSYGARLTGLMALVSEIAFRRIDVRLAAHLVKLAPQGGPVMRTHQELAVDIGTAREVVSRQLKDFERRGLVVLGRGSIEVRAPGALAALA